jgi:hypothetical protein
MTRFGKHVAAVVILLVGAASSTAFARGNCTAVVVVKADDPHYAQEIEKASR